MSSLPSALGGLSAHISPGRSPGMTPRNYGWHNCRASLSHWLTGPRPGRCLEPGSFGWVPFTQVCPGCLAHLLKCKSSQAWRAGQPSTPFNHHGTYDLPPCPRGPGGSLGSVQGVLKSFMWDGEVRVCPQLHPKGGSLKPCSSLSNLRGHRDKFPLQMAQEVTPS